MIVRFIIICLASICHVKADLPKISDPTALQDPELIGKYHTDAFQQLADKYASETPTSMKKVEIDMFKIVSSYCVGTGCIRQAYQAALQEIPLGARTVNEVLSETIDPGLVDYMQAYESLIYSVTLDNVDQVVEEMEVIQEKLREDETLEDDDKYLGLAAGSIAKESTRLWTDVSRDPNHPLRRVREALQTSKTKLQKDDRRLQGISIEFTGLDFDLSFTIFADFVTLIAFLGIPFPAIFASLWAYAISSSEQDNSPSTQPSISLMPSLYPSSIPSQLPSKSSMPSSIPSVGPSSLPSLTPSLNPSQKPSKSPAPSLFSSSNPSTLPSINPSTRPS